MSVDSFGADGLTVKSLNDIITDLTIGMQNIYGADINVDQNSPDGQLINLFAQACVDIRELIVQINSGFDPDQAVGSILDQRVVINDMERQGGTFTIVPIDIVTSGTVTLQGLDAAFNDIAGTGYTIQDNAGNQFILIDTITLPAGTATINFRAQKIGAVETITNTITNQVTIVLGVNSVNNSSASLTTGQNEETDAQLRTRRQQSVALASAGYLNGLLGTVLALTGVTQAKLYENFTDTVDANGIPAHGIWLIVENGANTDIATAIYDKKSYGANMKGSVVENIITDSGAIFQAKFDRPISQRLYVKFNLRKFISTTVFNTTAIAQYISDNINFYIGQPADTGSLTVLATNAVAAYGGGGAVLDLAISTDNVTFTDYISTATLAGQFTLAEGDIAITVV